LLSLQASYPVRELARPFAVVSIGPNMDHPEVRARILDAMAPAAAQLFGPRAAPQLVAGAPVVQAPEAPDDDGDPGPAGSGSTPAGDEPDWFAAAPAKPGNRLIKALRDKAEASELSGPMTEAQKGKVAGALRSLPFDQVATGLRIAFDAGTNDAGKLEVSAAQADAIIECSVDDEFLTLWREMAAETNGAAA
jgi:hypothetical protein